MKNIDQLRKKHFDNSNISFKEINHIPVVHISNDFATCNISLYGAQVLSFIPAHQKHDLLWISNKALFESGKAIRGGIPICFPWFGPGENGLPQHGFARLIEWDLISIVETENKGTKITFSLRDSAETLSIWNYSFEANLHVYVHSELRVELEVKNTGNTTFEYSDALHTYLQVGDVEKCRLSGLQNTNYLYPDASQLFLQSDDELVFIEEVNRRYFPHQVACKIYDGFLKRKIIIEKLNSKVTVVWNPGEKSSKQIKDMGPEEYKNFICVEAANTIDKVDMIQLNPGESHVLGTVVSVEGN